MSDWHLKGSVILACNCEFGCPCNFNALPSHGSCEGGWNWIIRDGRYGDVNLEGLGFSLLAKWPGAIHEGDGEAVAFVDDRADDAQREALEALVKGEVGGPWGILVVNTVSKLHGPTPVAYDVDLSDEFSSRIRVGDAVEIVVEPIKNPVTGAEIHPRAVLPEGLIFNDGALAASKSFWVRDGIAFDHTGKYAAVGSFDYTGP